MKRLHAVRKAIAANEGTAGMLELEFTDGTKQQIEVLRADVRELLMPLLHLCAVMGEKVPTARALPGTTPADALLVPSEELATTQMPGGGLWLLFRVGSEDFAFALPDPQAAQTLATALTTPSTTRLNT